VVLAWREGGGDVGAGRRGVGYHWTLFRSVVQGICFFFSIEEAITYSVLSFSSIPIHTVG